VTFDASAWTEAFETPRAFMFDLDGTLILSDRSLGQYKVLPGAVDYLEELGRRGIPYLALTNGSAYPASEQGPKLRALGLPISDAQLLTPSSVTADLLSRRGVESALILGSPGVGQALRDAGIRTLTSDEPDAPAAQSVYVGWHPDCSMKDIEIACDAIANGAALYVASEAPYFATSSGKSFGFSYAIAGAIQRVTRARIQLTGKPSLHALRFVSRQLGVPMRRIAVVGDDPLVEIMMARRAGAIGIGVTSGMTDAAAWAAQPLHRRPHRIAENLAGLKALELLEPRGPKCASEPIRPDPVAS